MAPHCDRSAATMDASRLSRYRHGTHPRAARYLTIGPMRQAGSPAAIGQGHTGQPHLPLPLCSRHPGDAAMSTDPCVRACVRSCVRAWICTHVSRAAHGDAAQEDLRSVEEGGQAQRGGHDTSLFGPAPTPARRLATIDLRASIPPASRTVPLASAVGTRTERSTLYHQNTGFLCCITTN